jgi:hypothetical protein
MGHKTTSDGDCTSQSSQRHATRHLGMQLPNQECGPRSWQIMPTMSSSKSRWQAMLRRCSAKKTEKMHYLLIFVTLCPLTQFCLNQAQGVAPTIYRIGGCGWFGRCHASASVPERRQDNITVMVHAKHLFGGFGNEIWCGQASRETVPIP